MNRFVGVKHFLLELLIIIVIFSVCSTIIIRIFQNANEKSKLSQDKTKAYTICQRTAEQFKNAQGLYNETMWIKIENNKYASYYTNEWYVCSKDKAKYILSIEIIENEINAGIIKRGIIKIKDGDTELNGLEVCCYKQKEVGR